MLFSFQDLAMVVFPIVQVLHWLARTLGLYKSSFLSIHFSFKANKQNSKCCKEDSSKHLHVIKNVVFPVFLGGHLLTIPAIRNASVVKVHPSIGAAALRTALVMAKKTVTMAQRWQRLHHITSTQRVADRLGQVRSVRKFD